MDGVYQEQTGPDGVMLRWYIRTTIILLPTLLSIVAFSLKLRFPIQTQEQVSTPSMIQFGFVSHLSV